MQSAPFIHIEDETELAQQAANQIVPGGGEIHLDMETHSKGGRWLACIPLRRIWFPVFDPPAPGRNWPAI
ncbi:MAG: hypothetical protein IPO22_14480 [Anaerolineales bacterium]|nr:hypothetical protein [Anaerolineales bacterium]